MKKFDFSGLREKKKIVMLTAYDCQMAKLLDETGIDLILVGDSLGMVVLGLKDTKNVSMGQMLHHTGAVASSVKNTPVIADMPAHSCDTVDTALHNAKLLLGAGADAVKIEGNKQEAIKALLEERIPVMGHLGLLPQTAEQYCVQGRDKGKAEEIFQDAVALANLGVFAIVLECVPTALAKRITDSIAVPTVGIGAGMHCSGQVLVINDLLGLDPGFKPKFVKRYAELAEEIKGAVSKFKQDVLNERFPDKEHSFY